MSVQNGGPGQVNQAVPVQGGAKLNRISIPDLVARKGKEQDRLPHRLYHARWRTPSTRMSTCCWSAIPSAW